MSSNRTVYHVVPNASGTKWVITQEGKDATREEFRTKGDAVEVATHRARPASAIASEGPQEQWQHGIREHLWG